MIKIALLSSPLCDFGKKIIDFSLKNVDEKIYTLNDLIGSNGTLVMFICNHCPYVKAIITKLVTTTRELEKIGINSIAIMPNDQDEYKEDNNKFLLEQITRAKFKFDYIVDDFQTIAKLFDVQCTPEFYYFNKDKKLKYRGRLDSNQKDPSMGKPELYYAVEEIILKGYCSSQQYPSMGCSIKWKS